MKAPFLALLPLAFVLRAAVAAEFRPAPQAFQQETARAFGSGQGLPVGRVQLIECAANGVCRAFLAGRWYECRDGVWREEARLAPANENEFAFADNEGNPSRVPVAWAAVRQIVRRGETNFVVSSGEVLAARGAGMHRWPSPKEVRINQAAVSPEGQLHVATSGGLFRLAAPSWELLRILDGGGRAWAAADVLGVAFDSTGQLWFATKAGVGCRGADGWRFIEGKDGLPWNDFTGIATGPGGVVWFGTHLGAVYFDGANWHYRQGPRWLPHDDVAQVAVDAQGGAWLGSAAGVGVIERRPMTLQQKAEFYEEEIARYVKRTPFGFVAEAALRKAGDKTSAQPQDSDNDGLWTAMYGAGECFAYAATRDPKAQVRARQAFEALRFLQKVTQGGPHAPPAGFIARTIRPADWPDPNVGRLEADREAQKHDKLWKVYEPRWPKSADGQWFWKSDTSSDELDGHYFFYPLYYDLCADTDAERERVREVVRAATDHLITHGFALIDHDGRPTRWAIFGPQFLNDDASWWPERGLNSLSILAYLAAAEHITGDPKYAAASRELIDRHGYAQNLMYAKAQRGPGSGNQSDDEMAFMDYYGLLRCSKDEALKARARQSFYYYFLNEAPERNPFFNFAYAAHNLRATAPTPWGNLPLDPVPGWHEDALATLRGFSLDRLNWPHRNSHRLDVRALPLTSSEDPDAPDPPGRRGCLVGGKVLPVENRHFTHWNTDPWQLDYAGNGNELAAGTVFLLPYYLGLYHGFVEKP